MEVTILGLVYLSEARISQGISSLLRFPRGGTDSDSFSLQSPFSQICFAFMRYFWVKLLNC